MTKSKKLCSIHGFKERHIDLFLAEEFCVNADFGRWFLEQCGGAPNCIFPAFDTEISVHGEEGESDVAVLFEREEGPPHRLFVENKITADKMPLQLERYIERAEAEIKSGRTGGHSIALFAPRTYHDPTCPEGVAFISFEDAAKCLRSISSSERISYRAEYLEAAAKGSRNARQVEPHIKKFWEAIYEIVEGKFGDYFIRPDKPPLSYYSPKTLEWPSSKRIRPDFHWRKGEVNLIFQNVNRQRLEQCIKETGHRPGKVREGNKFVAICVSGFAKFSPESDDPSATDTQNRVNEAYGKVQELMDYYIENRDVLDKAFDDGT